MNIDITMPVVLAGKLIIPETLRTIRVLGGEWEWRYVSLGSALASRYYERVYRSFLDRYPRFFEQRYSYKKSFHLAINTDTSAKMLEAGFA
jgi:hypothetical protein